MSKCHKKTVLIYDTLIKLASCHVVLLSEKNMEHILYVNIVCKSREELNILRSLRNMDKSNLYNMYIFPDF